jgi:hypothetical protein
MNKFDNIFKNYFTEAGDLDSAQPADVAKQIQNLATTKPQEVQDLKAVLSGQDPKQAQQQEQDSKTDPAHDLLTQLASDPKTNVSHVQGINTADSTLVKALNDRGLTFYTPSQQAATPATPPSNPTAQTATQQQNKTADGKYPGVNA